MPPQQQPHMPPGEQPCMPPPSNHACPPAATTHAPLEQTHMLPSRDQPCMPPQGATTHAPPVNRMTNRCKNITLPQTSFAGGKMGKKRMHATAGHVDFTFLGSLIEFLKPTLTENFCLKQSLNEILEKITAKDMESQLLHSGAIFL